MGQSAFVCLPVLQQNNSKSYEWMLMKFSVKADNVPTKSSLNFGDFPNSRGTLTCHHISSMFCNIVQLLII